LLRQCHVSEHMKSAEHLILRHCQLDIFAAKDILPVRG